MKNKQRHVDIPRGVIIFLLIVLKLLLPTKMVWVHVFGHHIGGGRVPKHVERIGLVDGDVLVVVHHHRLRPTRWEHSDLCHNELVFDAFGLSIFPPRAWQSRLHSVRRSDKET